MKPWGSTLVAALLSGLVTFGVMYVSVMGRYVTRSDVSTMIKVESPYVKDARWIGASLESIEDKIDMLIEAK